jgi:hypothetical protein
MPTAPENGSSGKRIHEAFLDHALAEALEGSPDLWIRLLRGGRFAHLADDARLLIEEQRSARKTVKHWWKHWWCRLPDGSEGETDLFLVFEAGAKRFAIHIENKPTDGKLSLRQARDYRPRAAFMANHKRWLSYADFETVLLAPQSFIEANREAASQFDRQISYEELSADIPIFGEALGDGK